MVAAKRYVPATGDIVWIRFSPQAGHEQAGHRPALVMSPKNYNEKTNLALFCPITSKIKGYPFEVLLPASSTVAGVVLADQIKSLDWQARRVQFESRASSQVVSEVREKMTVLLIPNLSDQVMAHSPQAAELLEAVDFFVSMFELVFDNDWEVSKSILTDPKHFIDDSGTFIWPLVDDECNDWANRGSLLAAYRDLLQCMEKSGMQRREF